jgi:hypothetical protein
MYMGFDIEITLSMKKLTKLQKLIKSQRVKPITDEEWKRLRLNAYKPAK